MKTKQQIIQKAIELTALRDGIKKLTGSTEGAALVGSDGIEVIDADTIRECYLATCAHIEMLHWILETGKGSPLIQQSIDNAGDAAADCEGMEVMIVPIPDTPAPIAN